MVEVDRPRWSPTRTAPAGVELTDPTVRPLGPPAVPPPFDLYRPALTRDPAHPARPRRGGAAPPAPGRRRCGSRPRRWPASGPRWTRAGFVEIHTPKIVASATESGANVFALDYFGRPAYLAQSPQFYKQLMVGVFERVYEVGPVFRAEPHDTVRHLAQYTSLDAELGFIADHRDVMAVLRDTLAGMLARRSPDAGRARPVAAARRGSAARRCRPRSRRCTSPRR